jgi:hypothetical protein
MTVIVKYDDSGGPYYRSANGIGSTETDRKRAIALDALLKSEMNAFEKRLSKNENLKDKLKANVELYWELGNILRTIFFKSGLIDETEKHFYWLNASLHVPKNLTAKDRGPNRLHLEYCFRLAGFPKDTAMKMKWGEWSYLFDSPGINREHRFDKWLETKMESDPSKFTRPSIRILGQSINRLLGTIETNDLNNDQLSRCYEAAWLIKDFFVLKEKDLPSDELKEILRTGIKNNYEYLGEVMDGIQEPITFAKLVAKKLN